jgi:hypothetical protein
MAQILRATLPEEFYDITSARLLTQPEPQYLHAKLFKAAMAASLSPLAALGLPGRPSIGASGAPYASPEDGRLVLSDGLYDRAIEVVPELGKGPGHTVRMNRPAFTDSTYTEASREVPAGASISTTPIAVSAEQVPITLKRYAGPYDNTNTAVQPYGVDRFDGTLAMHRPAQIASLHLQRDFDKTLDSIGVALFDAASTNVVRPVGMTDDDTPAVAGDFPMTYGLLARAERTMDDANTPVFPNGKRAMVLHPIQCEQLGQDEQFNKQSVFERDFNPLFNGTYWKSCGQWDLFKSTTLNSAANTNSITVYSGQIFVPGAIGVGLGEMPRVADSTSDNYGETALVIWLMYAGFAVLDERFLGSIRTS